MHFGSHVFSCVQSKDGRTEAGGGQDGASSSGAFSPAGSSTAPLVALAAPGPAPRAGPPLVPAPVLQTPVLSALAAASSGRVAALPVEEDKDLQTRIEEKVDMGMFVAAGRACWLNIGSPVHLHSGLESDIHLHAGAKPGLFLHAEYYAQGLIQIYSYTRQKTYENLGAT